MKSILMIFAATASLIFATESNAAVDASQATQLTAKYNCQACHAVDKKIVGPSYKDVAKKYVADKSAAQKLEHKVKTGGGGVWGAIPMPPNNVPEADIKTIVEWVLSLK